MKKLVVFDLDGTVIDSAADIGEAIAQAATSVCGLPPGTITLEQTRPLTGKSLETMFTMLLPAGQVYPMAELIQAYRAYYIEHCAVHTRPYPGMLDLLVELRQQGLKLAIATTKAKASVDPVAAQLGLGEYFDLVQGVEGFPSKPDPFILNLVMQKLEFLPAQTMMVGDTDNDVLCAQAAGVAVCAVSWGSWSARQLATLQPDYLVDQVAELRAVFTRLGILS